MHRSWPGSCVAGAGCVPPMSDSNRFAREYEQAQNAQLSAGLATAGIAVSPPSSPLVAANRSNLQRADQQIASLPSVPVMKVYIGQLKGTSEAIA